jgi:hypothetical protein
MINGTSIFKMKGFRDLELSIANRQMAIKENRPAV